MSRPPRAPGRRVWLAAAALLSAIGLGLGSAPLSLLGLAILSGWGINERLARREVDGLTARRWITGPLFAGGTCRVDVELTAPGPRRALLVEDQALDPSPDWWPGGAVDRSLDGSLSWEVKGAGDERTLLGEQVSLPARGRRTWGGLWASSAYPFGLVRHTRLLIAPHDVVILPALGKLLRHRSAVPPVGGGRAQQRGGRARPGAQADLRGLRAYAPGDPLRLVHWPTTARQGRLMVREFEEPPGDGALVVFPPPWGDPPALARRDRLLALVGGAQAPSDMLDRRRYLVGELELEVLVSFAATLCWEWATTVRWLGLVVAAPRPRVIGGAANRELAVRQLEALAVVERGQHADYDELLVALGAARRPRVAVYFIGPDDHYLVRALRGAGYRLSCLDPLDPATPVMFEAPDPIRRLAVRYDLCGAQP